ncbi:MAG TPA: DUF1801 domain-containing protein [Acidimicrobiales bacterium]|nr:DUF1801 domain-containing protein [Acidimicrobiales bacterium]
MPCRAALPPRRAVQCSSVARRAALPPAITLSVMTKNNDWRVATLFRLRTLIEQADPQVVEERKWIKPSNPDGVPTWSHDGIICTGETYKSHVKLTFAKGAHLKDPARLFNSSLEGNLRRAIDFQEGDKISEQAFKALIKEAVTLNKESAKKRK